MSATTDPSGYQGRLPCPWRAAGLLYLAVLLAGLAAGLWPETLWPAVERRDAAPLPTLQTLAVAQLMFFLLVYPMVLLKRFAPRPNHPGGEPKRPYWRLVVPESLLLLVLGGPFYLPAAFLADATTTDAVRCAICVASFLPLVWVAGAHLARARRGTSAVTLGLLVVALGLPAAYYVAIEFLPPAAAHWASTGTPAMIVWRNAAARIDTPWPGPLWALLAWPAVAAVAAALGLIIPARNGGSPSETHAPR